MKSVDEIRHEIAGDRPVYVVRCKDCKWFVDAPVECGFGWCDWMYRTIAETFYCGNAKRKEQNDE